MQILREKKFYIGMLVLVLTGLLLFVGARKYFFAPSGLSATSFEWLVEPQYELATDFASGVAWVKVKEYVWRQIDTQGRVLIDNYQARHVNAHDKETGLASFKSINYDKGFREGFINLSGDVVISPEYTFVNDFEHGMAPVGNKINWKYQYGIIDRRGKVVLPLVYEDIIPLSPRIFAVGRGGDWQDGYVERKWGYVNEKGEVIADYIFEFNDLDGDSQTIGTTFHTTLPPNLCLAGVDGQVGLINDKGQWVLPASYDIIYKATQEPIGVLKDGKVGFIDLKGNTVIDFQFEKLPSVDGCYQFSEGLAIVALPGSAPKGEYRSEGVAVVALSGSAPKGEYRTGVINEKGELLFTLPPGWPLGVYREGLVGVRTRGVSTSDWVYGLVDREGNWYPLPPYLKIFSHSLSDGILQVTVQENAGMYKKWMDGYIKVKIKQDR